jgi:uncharacterized RDD family membrane protein YckC
MHAYLSFDRCWICYFGRNTATPGKFFLNLRVVDVETYDASDPLSGRPSVMQVIGRCFVQVLNVFCFADYLYALGNNRKQCLHDVFSGTAVVYVINAEGRVRND